MTIMFVFVALIAANVAYSIRDSRNAETAQAMRDFYRVEYKKSYNAGIGEIKLLNCIR